MFGENYLIGEAEARILRGQLATDEITLESAKCITDEQGRSFLKVSLLLSSAARDDEDIPLYDNSVTLVQTIPLREPLKLKQRWFDEAVNIAMEALRQRLASASTKLQHSVLPQPGGIF